MTANKQLEYLDLSQNIIDNINYISQASINENKQNINKNQVLEPSFRYFKDDRNLNLTPAFMPPFTYKNKSLFPAEKPTQTEHDEIGINVAALKSYYDKQDYGNFKIRNQSIPEKNKHILSKQLFAMETF
jgi:hypothetical protein